MAVAVFLAALLLLIGLFALNNRRVTRLRFMYFPASFGSKFSKIQPFYSHYTKLSPEHKREFDWRVFYFLYTTNIEFRQFDGFPDADKTRLPHLLASVAAQMTFFLPCDIDLRVVKSRFWGTPILYESF